MMRKELMVAGIVVAAILSGCDLPALTSLSPMTRGVSRNLGEVEYASAFATAREVMEQHFSIASWDPDTGVIEAHPKMVEVRGERLLGGSPARHLAKMHVRRKNGQIVAHVSVALQREGSSIHRTRITAEENYDQVPNQTPAMDTAATTPDQNEVWTTRKHDRNLEREILDDLYKALHPEKK